MISEAITLEHPAHPEWRAHVPNDLDNDSFEALHIRFKDTDESVLNIANVLVQATVEVDLERKKFEAQNFHKLLLTPEDPGEYYKLSGTLENVGNYLIYFGSVATRALRDEGQRDKVAKITMQLAGKRQFGAWDATHELDEFARAIPQELKNVAPEAEVNNVGNNPERHNRYEFRPIFTNEEQTTGCADYGIVRRRRPVADILLPGSLPIEIFKESRALVIASQTDEYTRALMRNSTGKLLELGVTSPDLELAAATGNAFERAIKELKGRTRDVLPISADYFAVMRNPVFYPGTVDVAK